MKDLLLIIDMQNVYLPGQPWACPSMPAALKQIQRLLDHPACGAAYDVLFTRCIASEHPAGRWKQYNESHQAVISNPFLNQIVPALQPYLIKWPFCDKSTYSACSTSSLMNRLKDYDRILIAGVVAECCVLSTVNGLIDTGAHIVYLRDAAAGKSAANEQMVCGMMENLSPIHTQVMTVSEYLFSL